MTDLPKLIQDLKQTLQHYQQLGIEWIPGWEATVMSAAKEKSAEGTTAPPKKSRSPQTLEEIRAEIGDCKRCRLCEGRTHIVFGVGNPHAELMFVGEGPGRDEDIQGEPFVGRAGQLLNKIIEAMGMKRSDVYIGNVAKCRPPENRAPLPDEAATCIPFLHQQIEAVAPKVIVCLGSVATQFLLNTEQKITRLRGEWQDFKGTKVMPTYHPAYLLRNPEMKKPVWDDMKKVMEKLKEKI